MRGRLGAKRGLSAAIAVFSALLVYNTQVNHEELGAALGDNSLRMPALIGHAEMGARIATIANAELTRQAMMIAYVDDFWLMMWALILMLPVVLILSPVRVPRGVAAEPVVIGE